MDIVVGRVARLQNVALLHFALRAASPRDAAQNTLMFISFTAYFVELTSTFYLDIVVNGVARLQNVALLHFALRAASPRDAAQNTLMFISFTAYFVELTS
ncbi:MAG: hypothetical protein J5615_09900, partial [Fibrobacter sp.]|nr:hypothetical protein [Fibrobacter sp.]